MLLLLSPRIWMGLGRAVPGILSIALSALHSPVVAAWCMVIAVWADAAACAIARRMDDAPPKFQPAVTALDGLVDCLCFVFAPACFVLGAVPRWELIPALVVFVLAGIFRLARFQWEGLIDGGYRGLPVTYNGYIFPAAALLLSYAPEWNPVLFWHLPLLGSAALMVATFVVPEF